MGFDACRCPLRHRSWQWTDFHGASLEVMAALLLGRPWLGDWVRGRLASVPQLLAIEQAVGREGFKLVLLTRLYPAFPSSLLNLVDGPSEVSLRDDVIGLIAILPGTMLFCSLGVLAADLGT